MYAWIAESARKAKNVKFDQTAELSKNLEFKNFKDFEIFSFKHSKFFTYSLALWAKAF